MEQKELNDLRKDYTLLMEKLNLYSDTAFAWITEDFGNPTGTDSLKGIKREYRRLMERLSKLSHEEFSFVTA